MSNIDSYYLTLLDNVFKELEKTDISDKKVYIPVPNVIRHSNRKHTYVTNFMEICNSINRNSDEVMNYILSELCAKGSVDSSNHLYIRAIFNPQKIESIFKKYIKQYVICKWCNSLKTTLERDSELKKNYINCSICLSTTYV